MKLDKNLIEKFVNFCYKLNNESSWQNEEKKKNCLKNYFLKVDLVIKPGDSSQSILMKNLRNK